MNLATFWLIISTVITIISGTLYFTEMSFEELESLSAKRLKIIGICSFITMVITSVIVF